MYKCYRCGSITKSIRLANYIIIWYGPSSPGLRSVSSRVGFSTLAHWYTFRSDVLDIGRRDSPRANDIPSKQLKRRPMTRFRVHLCATPWTAGQARRRRRRRRVGVIPLSVVIDRFWSDWKRNRAPKTHTYTHTADCRYEWVKSTPPPLYYCCVVSTSSKTVFALYSCASERSSRTSRPNLDMGQRAAYSIGSRAES